MRLSPGEVLCGKYRIVRILAEGGMGTVYEARHEGLGTGVALKMLHPELARRTGLVARFVQEARVSAQIRSPHVVQVTDVEQEARGPFLVMELLAGESLQQRLDRDRRVERAVALDYAMQILAGLAVAHAMGVVHRDLKPDNVFLVPTPQGTVAKVLDFGIAKLRAAPEAMAGLTRPGVVMGTAEYMAPEQAYSADTVDARADLYAVGVMLYEMLAGRRPADGDDVQTIARTVIEGRIPSLGTLDPNLPPGLVAAVHRAMDPRIGARFGSAEEMQRALLPFATVLSAAGHQAAALATGTFAMTPAPASVHPTHPPGAAPPGQGGTTAPREPLPQAMTPAPTYASPGYGNQTAQVAYAPAPEGYDARTHLSPGPPAVDPNHTALRPSYAPPPGGPGAYGAPPPTPPGNYGAPPPQYSSPNLGSAGAYAMAPPARRGVPAWVIALLAAIAGGLGVVLIVLLRPPTGSDPGPVPTAPTTPPTSPTTPASVATTPPLGATTAPPVGATTPPVSPTTPHPAPPSSSAHKADAGAPDAGFPGFPPIPGFPPFPPVPNAFDAGLPPLPSALPTAITIPIPGWPAPP